MKPFRRDYRKLNSSVVIGGRFCYGADFFFDGKGKAKPRAARWGAVAQLMGLVARLPAEHVPRLSASPAIEGSADT